ncbi:MULTISPECIES: DUF2000 family protein [unclassified Agrobacterium]|uniref:DUF2000 family protein n=1 Tax=unclassified Agrobacterium TaxID=2632611 RepID=UPI002447EAD9|nr:MULTISPECIES: DUF2000 family protein [unclassified Agrobacterium]MDH0612829.1 DUF2000 family protein [Agrobacterium sp. GD03872]MDH0694693.1 DUF2000 family protein [Agrobacterium sp. GD03871]MDH1057909.1 DUF2000 family protein [Agrobacterium sp. GD03992]MDH2209198.1 DUF2000 family protein [Agrobacterium sp. GD03643]MDH2218689.1 DUF2000 family protein [Agrobacterium sp. GD03638]
MFDTKIAIILRDDLAVWQKLNVTAFLMSGIVAQTREIIGEPYRDGAGNVYNPLSIQPIVVMATDQETLRKIHQRSLERNVTTSLYIEEMFATGHDVANRQVFSEFSPGNAKVVGMALRADRKIVDKITKGAKLHA